MHDLIGDIHGHADALQKLLMTLGYERQRGVYRHSERRAIFLGDFIDRGPKPELLCRNIACVDWSVAKGGAVCLPLGRGATARPREVHMDHLTAC